MILDLVEKDLTNLFSSINKKSIKIRKLIERSNKIVIVGDDSLSSLLNYTFYLLSSKKKVLVAKSTNEAEKIDYDLMLYFQRIDQNQPLLRILANRGEEVERTDLPLLDSFSISPLTPLLVLVSEFSNRLKVSHTSKIIKDILESVKTLTEEAKQVKKILLSFGRCFCLGRSLGYPVAQEICSILTKKLKIHAESYPAGESKHGPIALIEEGFPVIQIIDNEKFEKKMINSIMEMKARGAEIITITHLLSNEIQRLSDYTLRIAIPNNLNTPIKHIPYIIVAILTAEQRLES